MAQMSLNLSPDIFNNWMKQSGLVKQLQLFLALAVIFILFLFSQLINTHTEPKKAKFNSAPSRQSAQSNARSEAPVQDQKRAKNVSETEINAFTKGFLEKFFSTEAEAFEFVKTHTKASLFAENLEPELRSRKEQNLDSKFALKSMYLESVSNTEVKAIVFGEEVFTSGEYVNREFTIEMIIDISAELENIQVSSIPVFRIN